MDQTTPLLHKRVFVVQTKVVLYLIVFRMAAGDRFPLAAQLRDWPCRAGIRMGNGQARWTGLAPDGQRLAGISLRGRGASEP
jgi:hypothetical protein